MARTRWAVALAAGVIAVAGCSTVRGSAAAGSASPVGAPGQAGAVWGIRFATPGHGFVFGAGWADLGFTTATDGVVVSGPADSDGNATQRSGQLLLTDDAGASWRRVRF